MSRKHYHGSLSRISDFDVQEFDVVPLAREDWATGDYVVGSVLPALSEATYVENPGGRNVEVVLGDSLVGVLGRRAATLGVVGDWQAIGDDLVIDVLTVGGLLGKATSVGWRAPPMIRLAYSGHVVREGVKVVMKDFVPSARGVVHGFPVILVIGTSMEAGKTSAAKVVIRQLKAGGVRVVGAKLTGAGRYRDILAMRDAGADAIYDFVDGGLPSTVCAHTEYRDSLNAVLTMIDAESPDVVVIEAGASPLEPYNGDTLMNEIGSQVHCTVLCASDPYAVVGVVRGFGIEPDIVSGIATNTSAGIDLIEKLTGLEALNLRDPASRPRLHQILERKLRGRAA